MGSYAGVSFSERTVNQRLSTWRPVRHLVERHYPHSNVNDVQDGGLANSPLRVLALVATAANLATLLAAQGITARTLVYCGTTYTGVMLWEVGEPQELQGGDYPWEVELEFRRASA